MHLLATPAVRAGRAARLRGAARACSLSLLVDQPLPPSYRERRDEMAMPMATSDNRGWGSLSSYHPKRNRPNAQLPRNWFDEDDYAPQTLTADPFAKPKPAAGDAPPAGGGGGGSDARTPSQPPRAPRVHPARAAAAPQPQAGEERPASPQRQRASPQAPEGGNAQPPGPPSPAGLPVGQVPYREGGKGRVLSKTQQQQRSTAAHTLQRAIERGEYLLERDPNAVILRHLRTAMNDGEHKDGDIVEAIRLASRLKDPVYAAKLLARLRVPDAKAYTLVMSGYAAVGDLPKLQLIWEKMKKRNISANVFTYNVVLNCFAVRRDEARAKALLGMMVQDGFTPDAVSYNTAIKACHSVEAAMDLLRTMEDKKLVVDKYTFMAVLEVCEHCADVDAAELTAQDMAAKGLFKDANASNTMMRVYLKQGDALSVMRVLQTMRQQLVKFNYETVELVIKACMLKVEKKGDMWCQLAFEMLSQGKQRVSRAACETSVKLADLGVTVDSMMEAGVYRDVAATWGRCVKRRKVQPPARENQDQPQD
eukprot:TRINITY_DN29733_c0_g1_i1.p1 TRINITY_DN29733_c0_g1~~TRINITY_DN29733_c0_g1_i1.p1  ORF type:complete len:536 (+),score=149.14 TRINITY_DN29733_c0_g1_i1:73-1680(+)